MIIKDINLLPPDILNLRKRKKRANVFILLTILMVLTMFSLLLIPYKELTQLEQQKRDLQENIFGMSNVVGNDKLLSIAKNKVDSRKKFLDQIEKDHNILLILEQIEKLMPTDMFFLSISTTENNLFISGIAKNDIVLADFIHSMKALNIFKNVFVPSISEIEENIGENNEKVVTKKFIMNCIIKTGKGN